MYTHRIIYVHNNIYLHNNPSRYYHSDVQTQVKNHDSTRKAETHRFVSP